MGIKFWERKLRKFMAVKEKIRRDYSMAESIANETAAKQKAENKTKDHQS